ncbi:MAG: hypothetical protein GXP58_07090 [Deltaproteobacteria bacterium]|nr:hypothetical protein [Deltaproteobacteria bacterium]
MPERERCRIEARLTERIGKASLLGNHYRKNLHIISRFLPQLLDRMEKGRVLSLVRLDRISPFCVEEMELIRHLARSREEALDLLGCYYALQLIFLNLDCLALLEKDRPRVTNRTASYKEVLLRAEAKFSLLYSALIRSFLDILSEGEENLPEFVICHVGARRDQDDIDVGIIHRAGGDLAALNRLVGKLNREMYRRATQMHFYLSEHSGSKWFSACIDVYEELMDVERTNLVVITQLFGAVPIAGSISLFEEFQERVVRRYTYRAGLDNRYYEGFIRGVVEEIRSLAAHRTRSGEIVPKVDGLRLAKILIAARRANLGIVGGHFWKVFKSLQRMDPAMQEEYASLEESLAFMELLRFLLHLIYAQEEGVFYTDAHCRAALDRVALLMGYGEPEGVHPSTVLLRSYFRYSRRIREVSGLFKEEFKKYIEFIQVFCRRRIERKILRLVKRDVLPSEGIPDPGRFRRTAGRIYASLAGTVVFPDCYETLHDCHDLSFLSYALHAVRTKRFARAGYMDRYVRYLVRFACREAGITGRSGFAIYATGGNAEGRALDNDYDMFVLCDPDRLDPASLQGAVHRMHRELTRVGNFPHHRIAEKIGTFVIPFNALAAYLDRREPEDYIERTELLGARRVFGDSVLHRRFEEEIIAGRVFRDKERLVRDLVRELQERHDYADTLAGECDLKQGKGGIFDISLVICLLKARFEIYETSPIRTLLLLKEKDPVHAGLYDVLFSTKRFFNDLRGMLCLIGLPEEVGTSLDVPLSFLEKGWSDSAALVRQVETKMERVREISEVLISSGKC